MKTFYTALMIFASTITCHAQTAEQIINDYIQVTGGKNWESVNAMKMITNFEGSDMKIEQVIYRDGRTYSKLNFQGNETVQSAYDGTTLWKTNMRTQKPEKSDSEAVENFKRNIGAFPNALIAYKWMGYSVSLEGEEKLDGVDCYKIKMTKKPLLTQGVEVANIEYYFIDKDSKVVIMIEAEITEGKMKGQIAQQKFSDYQEVNGLLIAFNISFGFKGQESQSITYEKVEINPEINNELFKYKGVN